jgi:hypothetical protein
MRILAMKNANGILLSRCGKHHTAPRTKKPALSNRFELLHLN